MAEYFFVLDTRSFESRIRPALAESWRLRRFDPARDLCVELLPAAADFAARFHTGAQESLLEQIADRLVPFDRAFWRTLVSEVLLFSALEIPEFQVNSDTLVCVLAPERGLGNSRDRGTFAAIEQALKGSRDLTFGAATYRPEHAGWNRSDDVVRLAEYLATVSTHGWQPQALAALSDLPEEEREDELAFAREWFPDLAALYSRSAAHRRTIVHEAIF